MGRYPEGPRGAGWRWGNTAPGVRGGKCRRATPDEIRREPIGEIRRLGRRAQKDEIRPFALRSRDNDHAPRRADAGCDRQRGPGNADEFRRRLSQRSPAPRRADAGCDRQRGPGNASGFRTLFPHKSPAPPRTGAGARGTACAAPLMVRRISAVVSVEAHCKAAGVLTSRNATFEGVPTRGRDR